MSTLRPSTIAIHLLTLFAFVIPSYSQNTYTITAPTTALVGVPTPITVAVTSSGAAAPSYSGNATISISNVTASATPNVLSFTPGNAVVTTQLMFSGTGAATVTVTDKIGVIATKSVAITVSTTQAICPECYASIGIGTTIHDKHWTDYGNNDNLLSANNVGPSSPVYLLGLSFQIRLHELNTFHSWYKSNGCNPTDYMSANPNSTYCYPWKAFVNLKFSSTASQTLSGFTFGLSHSLTAHLDFMVGVSYDAYNEPSAGFLNAAVQTVKAQQAAGNPNYAQFNAYSMEHELNQSFDGFPTQLIGPAGAAGALIYTGPILTTQYHPGGFVGINIPISLSSLFSGTNGGK